MTSLQAQLAEVEATQLGTSQTQLVLFIDVFCDLLTQQQHQTDILLETISGFRL